jgi:hypothetical protein
VRASELVPEGCPGVGAPLRWTWPNGRPAWAVQMGGLGSVQYGNASCGEAAEGMGVARQGAGSAAAGQGLLPGGTWAPAPAAFYACGAAQRVEGWQPLAAPCCCLLVTAGGHVGSV